MKLTDKEREMIIAQLRVEAIEQARKLGCTCKPEPVMKLTEYGLGRYDLPAWMSEHTPDCGVVRLER